MLQNITLKILSVFVLGFLPQNVFAKITIESKIQKFDLKTCSPQLKCLQLTAESANSSQFLPIYVLKNMTLSLSRKNIIHSDFGYIDYSQNVLIAELKDGSEILIDLKTLEEKKFTK